MDRQVTRGRHVCHPCALVGGFEIHWLNCGKIMHCRDRGPLGANPGHHDYPVVAQRLGQCEPELDIDPDRPQKVGV